MKTTHKERLNQLITALGMSKNKFAKAIGTSSAVVSNITTTDVNYGIELAEKIISTFPGINPTWLLSGIGEMMLSTPTENTQLDTQSDTQLGKKYAPNRVSAKQGENGPSGSVEGENTKHWTYVEGNEEISLEELLGARLGMRGEPEPHYHPEDKMYRFYLSLNPVEVEQRIENTMQDMMDALVDYNIVTGLVNERRTGFSSEPSYPLVTLKKAISIARTDYLETLNPKTDPRVRRLLYLIELEVNLEHWRNQTSNQIQKLTSYSQNGRALRENANIAAYGKPNTYGSQRPTVKQRRADEEIRSVEEMTELPE